MADLYKVKSFSKNPLKGNLAGVVLGAERLSENEMLAIASEVGACETAFIFPSAKADIAIRWFTPNTEVGVCVHATLAAIGVLKENAMLSSNLVKVETKYSQLFCQFKGEDIFVRIAGYCPLTKKVNVKKCQSLLPLSSTQITSASLVNIFDDTELIIEVPLWDDLTHLKPDQINYTEICRSLNVTGISLFTRQTLDIRNQIHTREFAPLYGYLEDPLCGMAAGALCASIEAKEVMRIEQGYFCNTAGVIIVEPEAADVFWIGGSYCITDSKTLSIPYAHIAVHGL